MLSAPVPHSRTLSTTRSVLIGFCASRIGSSHGLRVLTPRSSRANPAPLGNMTRVSGEIDVGAVLRPMIDVGLRETRSTPHADDVTFDDVVAIEQFRKVDRFRQPVAEPPAQEGIEGEPRLLTGHRRPVVEPWSGEERDIATRLQHPEEAFPERRHEAESLSQS